jgi:hypothetical protein
LSILKSLSHALIYEHWIWEAMEWKRNLPTVSA